MTLQDRLGIVETDLYPLIRQATEIEEVAAAVVAPPIFTSSFTLLTVRFNWSAVVGAVQYEVRKGTDWDTAFLEFRSSSLQADIDALLIGSHNYLIKSINSAGAYSPDSTACEVIVPPLGPISISKQVIDNNVLLNWNAPTSVFRILYYEVFKDTELIGLVDSTFFMRFENVAGVYVYKIVALDTAGNRSAPSEIAVEVQSPPDYALTDQRTSSLNGTRVNVLLMPGPKLLANVAPETWEFHFFSRSWLDPQDQIDDGFPIYIQPAALTGSYEEIIDYGTVITNVIATISFNFQILTPPETMGVVVKMAASDDGVTYSAFGLGSSQFLPSVRFLKFRLEFTGSSEAALAEIFNVVISLNVKRENDGGELDALSSDVGGTTVLFNKDFKDVESITATVKSVTEPYTAIIDFVDIPDPDGFKVYVFDTTGNRVSKTIEWKARGIV